MTSKKPLDQNLAISLERLKAARAANRERFIREKQAERNKGQGDLLNPETTPPVRRHWVD